MKIAENPTRGIGLASDGATVGVVDRTLLPHRFATLRRGTKVTTERGAVTAKSLRTAGS